MAKGTVGWRKLPERTIQPSPIGLPFPKKTHKIACTLARRKVNKA